MTINAQTIDWSNFDEQLMNEAMFSEMNQYVKKIHNGDSLVLSKVIQNQIMPRNYNLIKNNYNFPLHQLHNMEWLIPGRGNDLHDSLRTKIIEENANPKLLESKWMPDFECYGLFCYTEILESVCYRGYETGHTYQDVAIHFIDGWNLSPPHAAWMNANYENEVIVGMTAYFDTETRTIFVSFVHVS
jgi:hypothetical protein